MRLQREFPLTRDGYFLSLSVGPQGRARRKDKM
jgi:hypothetical protein